MNINIIIILPNKDIIIILVITKLSFPYLSNSTVILKGEILLNIFTMVEQPIDNIVISAPYVNKNNGSFYGHFKSSFSKFCITILFRRTLT